ncbi:hypothetical protein C8Q77DRAFT_1220377 [Trametes polyzona]|nr:hypothetical protein C8Q77DRAFT_1220377 [Trametes polyzona]
MSDTTPTSSTLVVRKPRNPQPHNTITASRLWPLVLADEHLARWSTPHASAFQASLHTLLPAPAALCLQQTILEGLETRTKKNYGAGLLCFTQFCDTMNVPEIVCMPAFEVLIAAFVAHHAGSVRHDTINNWLAELAFWHALNGPKKIEPPPLPKRPPVTLEHMHALFAGLNLSNTFDAAVFAVASSAFWGCRRLGELVIPSRRTFDCRKHASAVTMVGVRNLPSGTQYAVFHIPWTKTTKQNGADVILTANSDPTNPLNHRAVNKRVPGKAPLFAFESNDTVDRWAPMTRDWFLAHCNEVWTSAGLNMLTGHCFRIGGATELLLRGTHPDIVATQGGWKSRSFLEYWRKIEQILPLFISNSFDQSRAQLLLNTMDQCRRRHNS